MRNRAQTRHPSESQQGFTLPEMLVALVVSSFLVLGLFRIWNQNRRTTDLIANKGDFRDRATLATTRVNRTVTMAGFGISRMDVVSRRSGSGTDTLVVYSNPSERRTTLIESVPAGAREIKVFKDSGFAVGCFLGITDSLKNEYARVEGIGGNASDGYLLTLSGGLANAYLAGVPDIYPVQREKIFADSAAKSLVRVVDDRRQALGGGITEFRVQLLDNTGNPAATQRELRVITFTLSGNYKAPAGMPSLMTFTSTVIPRNIL
jgi:prepilin-type N-terminal cleavage/methylation domain-containing protein